MRKFVALVLSLFVLVSVNAQSSDPKLKERLDTYMQLNKQLKFKELMEYIHPVLFKIAPKEDMITAFEQGFNNEDVSITIDTIRLQNIGPVFKHESGTYHKVDYYMVMGLEFKDKSILSDTSFVAFMTNNLQSSFPSKKVAFVPATTTFSISGADILIAIKDNDTTPWLFLGYDKSKEAVLSQLLHADVLKHFGLDK